MNQYSTREAARKVGVDWRTIQRYIAAEKIPAPPLQRLGGAKFRLWTEQDIERLRALLPKIRDDRKMRYLKKHSTVSNQSTAGRDLRQSVESKSKKKKPQPGATLPRHAQERRASGTPAAVPHNQLQKKSKP